MAIGGLNNLINDVMNELILKVIYFIYSKYTFAKS